MNSTLSMGRLACVSNRWFFSAASAAAVMALSGCGSWQQLSVRDDNASSIAVRAAFRPQAWARDERPGPGFELGFERFRADSVRRLAAGETLILDNQNVTGPGDMDQSAVVRRAHVVYTHPIYFGSVFQLEPFLGLAHLRLRYRAMPAGSAVRPELNASTTGVFGGITPRVRVNDWVSVEARFSLMPNYDRVDVYSNAAEVAAVLTPVPALALRLGYAQRRVGVDFNADANWTQLDVRADGPFATLQFEF
jgi:hypothetical protein